MTQPEPSATTALPSGSRIVHIGPSKTGTTSLQAAMWDARERLRAQGIEYAGDSRHSATAARAGARMHDVRGSDIEDPPPWMWKALVREIQDSHADRVVLSSEFLAHADDAAIRSIVDQIGPATIQIVVTLRPLAKMLSSLWQQRLQVGGTLTFTDWLETQLGREGTVPARRLWHRHRHDRLVERWARVVGPDRMTVVVVDSADHQRILRDVEGLLGVTAGTFRLQDDFGNRSLTLPEARALRVLNRQLRAVGVNRIDHLYIVRDGVARLLKLRTPTPGEARIRLPAWAGDRAAAMAAEIVGGIASSGIRVVGDLSVLTEIPETVAEEDEDTQLVPDDIAASMTMGVAFEAGMLRSSRVIREHDGLAEAVPMRYLSNRDLVQLPLDRLRRFGPRMARKRLRLHR
jgi:hypothetical protein